MGAAYFSDKKLQYQIEWKRNEMIETAAKTGLLSSQTLRKSTELDKLLNLQQGCTYIPTRNGNQN